MPPKPKIALFANRDNPQLQAVSLAIARKNGVGLPMDIQLGGNGRPLVSMERKRLFWDGVDFSGIYAAHILCTAPNTLVCLPPMLNAASYAQYRAGYLIEQEYQAAVAGFFELFAASGGLVVNPLDKAYIDHDSKSQFYEKLRAWGFDQPKSLTTNDPATALAFIEKFGEVIIKPAMGVGSARVIGKQDLENIEDIRLCPVLLQERVTGHTLRVHIVGDTVVCTVKVVGQGVDSRTGKRKIIPVLPDEAQAQRIVRASRLLGLHFSAWDVIQTIDGRFVFLDCNPGPYILWIGKDLAGKVFEQLASYMVTYAKTGCEQKASSAISPISFN